MGVRPEVPLLQAPCGREGYGARMQAAQASNDAAAAGDCESGTAELQEAAAPVASRQRPWRRRRQHGVAPAAPWPWRPGPLRRYPLD
jgi:hypothetical protein